MHLLRLLSVAAMVLFDANLANANCPGCDDKIVLNTKLADCFVRKSAELEQEASTQPDVFVDLTECQTDVLTRGNLPTDTSSMPILNTMFILDSVALPCLISYFSANIDKIDPYKEVYISKLCGK